jgi:hypothetical protein
MHVPDAAASWLAGIYLQEARMAVKGTGASAWLAYAVLAVPMATVATDRRGL